MGTVKKITRKRINEALRRNTRLYLSEQINRKTWASRDKKLNELLAQADSKNSQPSLF